MVPGQVGVPGESAVRAVDREVGRQELAGVPLQHMEADHVKGHRMREEPVSYNLAQV